MFNFHEVPFSCAKHNYFIQFEFNLPTNTQLSTIIKKTELVKEINCKWDTHPIGFAQGLKVNAVAFGW